MDSVQAVAEEMADRYWEQGGRAEHVASIAKAAGSLRDEDLRDLRRRFHGDSDSEEVPENESPQQAANREMRRQMRRMISRGEAAAKAEQQPRRDHRR